MRLFQCLFNKNKQSISPQQLSQNSNVIGTYIIPLSDIELTVEIRNDNNIILFNLDNIITGLKTDNKKNIIKKLEIYDDYKQYIDNLNIVEYLTYQGFLKLLFIFSSGKNAIEFKNWYDASISKKYSYSSIINDIFAKFTFPCIYLLHIGDYKSYSNVYKFGRTDNFGRRYKELNKSYGIIFKIITLQYIDQEFLSKAETEVSKYVSEYLLPIENRQELFSIDTINTVCELYKTLGQKYSIKNKKLQDRIQVLESENEVLVYKNKLLELQLKNHNNI